VSTRSPTDPSIGPAGTTRSAPEAPYRGLTPYAEQDASFFFGRESECDIVIANLMASRLTLLYGASGVGKTSLLRAGVTHSLQASSEANLARYGAPEFVVVYFNRWSGDPVQALIQSVRESVGSVLGDRADRAQIPAGPLTEVLHAWTSFLDADLLIILDQFEEYFIYHPDEQAGGSFAQTFVDAVNRADLRASFLVAIREDTLARLDRFKGRLPNLFDNYLRTRHLDMTAARAAIEKPLKAYNDLLPHAEPFRAEPDLVSTVLDEVQIGKVVLGAAGRGAVDQGGAIADPRVETPYLQLVLTRLWREEAASGSRTLRLETLRRLGGARRIVRTHLDEALAELSTEQQDVAARVFHHLVTPSGTKIAHTVSDLADYTELSEPAVASLLETLSSGEVRVLRRVAVAGREDDAPYEIFHDVLAQAILDWRARHIQARAAEARLAVTIQRGAERTRAAEERAHRYREWLRRGSVVAMVILILLLATIAVLARQAQQTALQGRRELRQGLRSSQLATQSLKDLSNDPVSSLRLAVEAFDAQPSPAAEYALRQAMSQSRVRTVLRGHRDSVLSAAYSPDGRHALTASMDSTLRIWDTASGDQVAQLELAAPARHFAGRPQFSRDGRLVLAATRAEPGEIYVWPWRQGGDPVVLRTPSTVNAAAFSPDADLVVSGHGDDTARVWDWRDTRPVTFGRPSKDVDVTSVAFAPDGRHVAAGDSLGTVRVWPVADPGAERTLPGHTGYVNQVEFSRDGATLATASDDGTARLHRWRTGAPATVLSGQGSGVYRLAFSPDGRRIATAGVDTTASVWDVAFGRMVAQLGGHLAEQYDISFSPDGRMVATASYDTSARVFEVATGQALAILRGRSGTVFTVQFAPDGRTLVTGNADGTARTWTVTSGLTLAGHRDLVNRATADGDGRFLVTASDDGTARVWDARTGRSLAVLREQGGAVNDASFDPDGERVVTAGTDAEGAGIARVWNWRSGTGKVLYRTWDSGVNSARFTGDGKLLVLTTNENAQIWDVRANRLRKKIGLSEAERAHNAFAVFTDASLSPDGRLVVTSHLDRAARLWDAATGTLVRSLAIPAGIVQSAEFDHSGRSIVTAGDDGIARVWDPATGKVVHSLVSPSGELRSASFSPDGGRVVAGSSSGTTLVSDVASERLLAAVQRHSGMINTARFTPDGRRIITASDDHTGRIYPCELCAPASDVLASARRQLARLS
jgi:WD40 repeat protein